MLLGVLVPLLGQQVVNHSLGLLIGAGAVDVHQVQHQKVPVPGAVRLL